MDDDDDGDQRLPHRPPGAQDVDLEELRGLGVHYWKVVSFVSLLFENAILTVFFSAGCSKLRGGRPSTKDKGRTRLQLYRRRDSLPREATKL